MQIPVHGYTVCGVREINPGYGDNTFQPGVLNSCSGRALAGTASERHCQQIQHHHPGDPGMSFPTPARQDNSTSNSMHWLPHSIFWNWLAKSCNLSLSSQKMSLLHNLKYDRAFSIHLDLYSIFPYSFFLNLRNPRKM